jgi:hypothetical protein
MGHCFGDVRHASGFEIDLISSLLRRNLVGPQQLIKPYPVKHLGSHSICHGKGHFSAILRGIDHVFSAIRISTAANVFGT